MTDIDKALKNATKIGEYVAKKFSKHKLYVRRRARPDDQGFIEIALRPEGGDYRDESATAYSDEYFASATKDNAKQKAEQIFSDLKTSVTAR